MSAPAAVLGVGLATALGRGADRTLWRLHAGVRAFAPSRLMAPYFPESPVCLATWLRAPAPSRSAALAEHAAREALGDAGVDPRADAVDLVVGASLGGMYESELELAAWFVGEADAPDDARLACHGVHAVTEHLVSVLGPFARATTISSACSSGAVALGLAMGRVARGDARYVLAGGVDALARITTLGFHALGAVDPLGARPFDAARAGLGLGEGAGFVLLGARGARRRVFLAGFAARSESFHATQPEPSGRLIDELDAAALAGAGLRAGDVGYVSAHGTGTLQNDAIEAAAIRRVFGPLVKVSSQKGALGHTLAACGAVEAVVAADVVATGRLPPALATSPMDGVTLVGAGETADVRAAVSHSFGFGGTGAVLVLSREPGVSVPEGRAELSVTAAVAALPEGLLAGESLAHAFHHGEIRPALLRGRPSPLRRVDPASALAVALASELVAIRRPPAARTAVVVASAYGVPDAACAFVARARERGPSRVSPMDFPHLVPSAPASNVSIALGLGGPALTVIDPFAGVCSALSLASELVALDLADAVVVLVVEPESRVCEELLTPRVSGFDRRGWGGAALLVEREGAAGLRVATVGRSQLTALSPRSPRHAGWAQGGGLPGWTSPASLSACVGAHEASGGVALALLTQALLDGALDEACVEARAAGVHGRVVLSR